MEALVHFFWNWGMTKVNMLTTIVACSLGCGFEFFVSFHELLHFHILLEFIHEESHIFSITFGAIRLFLFFFFTWALNYHLFVLALLVSLESNLLLSYGSDAFGEVVDMIDPFNVHFMVHDPTKHIIRWHPLIGGVLVDQGNHIVFIGL
jgi:hypothetical protein